MNLFSFIKQKVPILPVITQYITLKKAGAYLKGRCPFHNEKTGSFTVSPDKDIFYCFGCHTGGDVIAFIAKIENCSQFEAVKLLAEQYNIQLQDFEQNKNLQNFENKKKYIETCTAFLLWINKNLSKSKISQEYLALREINIKSIKYFEIGFMPGNSKAIKDLIAFAQKQNILTQDLIEAKILLESKNGLYSPFEDRVIFPIKDHLGKLCGFGGRVIQQIDNRPKYYNSHDHEFFNKGSILFGLNLAKKRIQEKSAAFLVEGYMDAITMVQYGFENTVATLGTACTQEHLNQLSRYAQKLYIIYDQDAAGQKAITRLIELCWKVNIELYVINLPKEEDPASYLQKGKDLKPLILNSKDIFNFYIQTLGANFENQSLSQRIISTKKLIITISNIDDTLKQDLLLKQASETFKIPFETLKYELNKKNNKTLTEINNNKDKIKNKTQENNNLVELTNKITLLEKKLFSAIIYQKNKIDKEDAQFLKTWFSFPLNQLFSKIYKIKILNNIEYFGEYFGEYFNESNEFNNEEKNFISKIIIESSDSNNISLEQLLNEFYRKQWKALVYKIKSKIIQAEQTGDSNLIKNLLANLELLKKKILQRGINGQKS